MRLDQLQFIWDFFLLLKSYHVLKNNSSENNVSPVLSGSISYLVKYGSFWQFMNCHNKPQALSFFLTLREGCGGQPADDKLPAPADRKHKLHKYLHK